MIDIAALTATTAMSAFDWADADAEQATAALAGAPLARVIDAAEDTVVVFADGQALRVFQRDPFAGVFVYQIGRPRDGA